MLRHRDQDQAAHHGRGPDQGDRRRRADPHHVQPDRSRPPAGSARRSPTCRTSRSAPPRAAGSGRASSSGEGYETLLTADYSQIELRIMAHLSGDESLIAAFESGHDFHRPPPPGSSTLPPEQVDGELRAQDQGDELRPGLRAVRLRAVRRSSTSRWPRPGRSRRSTSRSSAASATSSTTIVAQARNDGYTETILGRRRYLPDLTSDNRQRREMAERMALNAPDPGLGGRHHQGRDAQRAAARCSEAALRSRMLLQVHDELVFEVAPGELTTLRELVTDRMSAAYSPARPAGGLHGRRPHLGGRRPLTAGRT